MGLEKVRVHSRGRLILIFLPCGVYIVTRFAIFFYQIRLDALIDNKHMQYWEWTARQLDSEPSQFIVVHFTWITHIIAIISTIVNELYGQ